VRLGIPGVTVACCPQPGDLSVSHFTCSCAEAESHGAGVRRYGHSGLRGKVVVAGDIPSPAVAAGRWLLLTELSFLTGKMGSPPHIAREIVKN
jgi:hypothetical protein